MVVPKPNPTKDALLKLMAEKDEVEKKIQQYGDVLSANDNVGMHGPLVDEDGFPRNDIDVYQVRQARQQLICLQNDHKKLMDEIEKLLHKLHAEAKEEERQERLTGKTAGMTLNEANSGSGVGSSSSFNGDAANAVAIRIQEADEHLRPLVKVNLVSPGSPAEEAGLRIDDVILKFGTVNASNFNNDLSKIGDLVRHMQNQRINLKVKRNEEILDMILIPKTWSGRGLLGCNIILP